MLRRGGQFRCTRAASEQMPQPQDSEAQQCYPS
uniref:Uncharacterized protein n=1 Tax=Triticum urartu TaxID=4572 RepID=A0A8R7JXI8_TRIUA